MQYAPEEWTRERLAWRAVIQLNLLRSILAIVDALQAESNDGDGQGPDSEDVDEVDLDGSATEEPPPVNSDLPVLPSPTANGSEPASREHSLIDSIDPSSSTSTLSPTDDTETSTSASPTTPITPFTPFSSSHPLTPSSSHRHPFSTSDLSAETPATATTVQQHPLSPTTASTPSSILTRRLGPLRGVYADLRRALGAGVDEVQLGSASGVYGVAGLPSYRAKRKKEVQVDVRRWMELLSSATDYNGSGAVTPRASDSSASSATHGRVGSVAQLEEATTIIASLRADMQALWADEGVRRVLRKRGMLGGVDASGQEGAQGRSDSAGLWADQVGIRKDTRKVGRQGTLEEAGGFFLNDISRIATLTYTPSDEDIVRSRLRTLGVQEYRLRIEKGDIPGE